jgi:phenylalanyl-tRNA synthetase alpha chain
LKGEASARELSEKSGVAYSSLMSLLPALEDNGLVSLERSTQSGVSLTGEGRDYAKNGLPEKRLFDSISGGETPGQAAQQFGGIALQWAKKKGFVKIEGGKLVKQSAKKDALEEFLETPSADSPALPEALERKLAVLEEQKSVTAKITPAGRKALEGGVVESRLTPDDLKTGAWHEKNYAEYDLETVVAEAFPGKKNAYKEFLNEVRMRLAGMGFREVHGPLVELEFWNMDALFMAQDHPAREIHDVFQVEGDYGAEKPPKSVLGGVKKAHEQGVEGSTGWGYKWDPEVAMRLVLRSQTTAVSARKLACGVEPPARLFCIGTVFRPDEIDWKHFIEFNQCEGIVADEKTSFRQLLGYLRDFAVEVFGAEEVRFAPSYFPFTEPSVELFAKIPGRGWAEVGGAGLFRPEMLEPLGVKVPVIAWGLGIGRLAMIRLGINDIRDINAKDLKKLR